MSSSDEAVQLTNNDASNFKAYAVNKGYWHDPYIGLFVGSSNTSSLKQSEHKPPEMSRGYYVRVKAIHSIVRRFIDKHRQLNAKCQVLNLGAGYDTLYFLLADDNKLPHNYVETDFARVISSKCRLIRSKKLLAEKIKFEMPPAPAMNNLTINDANSTNTSTNTTTTNNNGFAVPLSLPRLPVVAHTPLPPTSELHTANYHLVSADLRNLAELDKKLNDCNLDFTLPTLIIAECVLVYMKLDYSLALLKHLANKFSNCLFINYEQTNLSDRFGEIMLDNMEMRSCQLLGVDACKSNESQRQRLIDAQFDEKLCQVMTMTDYYKNKLEKSDRERIESIEFLDESELLMQLLDHYCLCLAANNTELSDMLI